MQKITPFLWFDDNAEEAVDFYASVFKDSRIVRKLHMSDEVPGPKGKVMVITFELEGQQFMALNGGPGVFEFTGAISLLVNCESQAEINYYWDKLSADPAAEQCGWLKDKYGVYWQITPVSMDDFLGDADPEKARRATRAMLQMKKIDIETLQRAYDGQA